MTARKREVGQPLRSTGSTKLAAATPPQTARGDPRDKTPPTGPAPRTCGAASDTECARTQLLRFDGAR